MARTIPAFKVVASADKIQNFVGQRVEQHAVDREIAALHIFTRIFTEANLIGMAAVGVANVRTKGRHFNRVHASGAMALLARHGWLVGWERHEHDSELLADGISLREGLHDLPWSRIGGNVIVGRLAAEKKIADASSSEVGLVATLAQCANDFDGVLFRARHRY